MPKPRAGLVQEILRIYDEEKRKAASDEAKFYSTKFTSPILICTDCKARTPAILDKKAGDTVCTECGLVLNAREMVETQYGRGAGGYSKGTSDSDKLDLMTGKRHIENGRTRRYYKTMLAKKVGKEIEGLVGNDNKICELAKAMFEKYSNTLETVRNRDVVIESCIKAADTKLKLKAKVHEIKKLEFKCKKCDQVYSTKQDLKYHVCPKK